MPKRKHAIFHSAIGRKYGYIPGLLSECTYAPAFVKFSRFLIRAIKE